MSEDNNKPEQQNIPQEDDLIAIPTEPVQVQNIPWAKKHWGDFKKAYKHAYMNIVVLPLKNDSEETLIDRLYRWSDFPLATQVFPFFAYRAIEKRLLGQFYVCQVGINYLLQHFNYIQYPGYKSESKEKQLLTELVESLCLSGISTGLAALLPRTNRFKFGYYLLTTCIIGIPAAIGSIWCRRDSLKNGLPIFDDYLQIKGTSKRAATMAASEVGISRFLLGFSQYTLPILLMKPFETRFNMAFYSWQKTLLFTELSFMASLFLTSCNCAVFMPFSKIHGGIYKDNEGKQQDLKEDLLFFKGI
ncbi:hypothetical protein WA158_007667 [Blastocystis sp. Blastoise]